MAAEECRSANRSIPLGAMVGLATLLISGTVTWFVCSGLIPAGELGDSVYPLYEAALATGKLYVFVALFVGTILSCLASANGCINDSAEAWSALSRDTLLPHLFAQQHPKYRSNYRSIIFLLPIIVLLTRSIMSPQDIYQVPTLLFPKHLDFSGYAEAFDRRVH